MTLDEARTIWLTLIGTDWYDYVDLVSHTMFYGTLDAAYIELRNANMLEINHNTSRIKITCKS
jgi:hypothetical protein